MPEQILPHFAFLNRIHGRTLRTLEVLGEVLHIAERSKDAELGWRVHAGSNTHLERFYWDCTDGIKIWCKLLRQLKQNAK